MSDSSLAKYKVTIITVVLIVIAFLAGVSIGKGNDNVKSNSAVLNVKSSQLTPTSINLDTFWAVWKTLDEKFVITHKNAKTITDQDKIYGAIEGLTAAYGDPYTVFMPPVESKDFETSISGNFEGVGMELAIKNGSIVVVAPLKNTPAYRAGIKSGDIVLSINGTSTADMSVDKAVSLIRGKAGTEVTLKFARAGNPNPLEMKIIREVINVPTIDTEIKGDVFVIKLYNFYAPSPEQFRGALREFVDTGKNKLVLDLRGNPGGYLEAAVDMASWFLPLGKVVVREDFGKNIEEQVYRSKGYDVFKSGLKMAILVDGGSASAAEILAGALKEQGVAKLVGTKTFGKGSVQELLKMTSDTSLKVTIAKWLTPNGISISEDGLKPDYEVKFTDADVKAGNDVQMNKAIEILK